MEAETGHSSYKSFLEALPETGPQYKHLLAQMGQNGVPFGDVNVLDILENGRASIIMNLRGYRQDAAGRLINVMGLDLKSNCRKLLKTLRSSPENTMARIIMCSIPGGSNLHPCLVDTISLGLKIQPAVFATLLSIAQEYSAEDILCRRLGPEYVTVGNSIATVARNYILNKRVPPVLFVAKVRHDRRRHFPFLDDDYDDMVTETLMSEIYGSISLCQTASDMRLPNDLAPNLYLDRLSNHVYLNVLSRYVQNGVDADVQSDGQNGADADVQSDDQKDAAANVRSDGLLLDAILPLLHLEVLYLHAQCEITQQALLTAQRETGDLLEQECYKRLDARRFELRRKLEGLEESNIRFVKFARLQNSAKWLEGQLWISQKEETREAIIEARAKEAEARDYMQLQIGNLSIKESRKSIQLSNQQMSEAKRGKRIEIRVV